MYIYTFSKVNALRRRGGESPLFSTSRIKSLKKSGTSLAVQWLRLHASTAGSAGLIPGWGTKIPHATTRQQKKKSFLFLICIYPYTSNVGSRLKKRKLGKVRERFLP